MQFTPILQILALTLGIVLSSGGIIVAIVYFKSISKTAKFNGSDKITTDAIINLQATVAAVQTRAQIQQEQIGKQDTLIAASNREVAKLNGIIDTLKNIPLEKIEKHMSDVNEILKAILPLIPTQVQHTITEKTTTSSATPTK